MIHCMVQRRMAPGHTKLPLSNEPPVSGYRKCSIQQQHPDFSLESSATAILETFATTTQAGTTNYSSTDRRISHTVNSEGSSRAGSASEQVPGIHESPRSDGHSSRAGEETSSIGPAQRLCVGGKKRLSPYRKVSDVREARRASLDGSFVARNLDKDQASTEKFAYVSLDGRLMNAERATSSKNIGGGRLPEKEIQASKEIDPLQRVLIVAVSAAAAAAAGKYQRTEEFCRLRNAVDARERELEAMRQKLSNLGKQESRPALESVYGQTPAASAGNRRAVGSHEAPDIAPSTFQKREEEEEEEEARECDFTLGESALTLATSEQEQQQQQQQVKNNNRLSTQESSAKEMAMEVDGSSVWQEEEQHEEAAAAAMVSDDSEEAKWYCNPMLQTGEHYFEMCTPEYDDPLFSNRIPAAAPQNSGWKSRRRDTGGLILPSSLPQTNNNNNNNLAKTSSNSSELAVRRTQLSARHSKKPQSEFRVADDSAEQLIGELERAAEKVADMENQIKSLKHYAAETDANWKDSEVKLEEWIEGDYGSQAKAHMEIQELRRRLYAQESEYKSLERSCKVMLAVKSKEISELREDCQRRDTALDDITAAARATRAASDERIGVLEDLCRRKDSVIFDLKQDILALESKVNGLRTFHPAAMLHGRPHSCMCLPSHQSDELVVANMSLPDTSHENPATRRFPYYLPPPVQSAAQGQMSFGESQKDWLSEGNDGRGGCSSSSMLQSCEDYTAVDKPLPAYRFDQESSKDVFSPPPSTIGDDFHELESSLLALSVEEERKTGSTTSSGRSRNLPTPSPDNYHVVEESNFNHNLPRQKKKSPVTSTNTLMGRVQTNAAASMMVNESMRASCSSSSTGKLSSGKKKAKRESLCSPRTSVEILGSVGTNTSYDPRRAVSVDLTNGGFKALARNGLKENNSIKQRRWL